MFVVEGEKSPFVSSIKRITLLYVLHFNKSYTREIFAALNYEIYQIINPFLNLRISANDDKFNGRSQ